MADTGDCPTCDGTRFCIHPSIETQGLVAISCPDCEDDVVIVQCEGCETLLDDETCLHDIEGCPLCPECWDAMLLRNGCSRNADGRIVGELLP